MNENVPTEQVVVTGTPVDTTNTKTVFGALNSPTPAWATWMFRVFLGLTTAAAVWVSGTNLIDPALKNEIVLILKVLDPIVFMVSKLFGLVPTDVPADSE